MGLARSPLPSLLFFFLPLTIPGYMQDAHTHSPWDSPPGLMLPLLAKSLRGTNRGTKALEREIVSGDKR